MKHREDNPEQTCFECKVVFRRPYGRRSWVHGDMVFCSKGCRSDWRYRGRQRRYYKANPEAFKERSREYYTLHRTEILVRMKRIREKRKAFLNRSEE